MSLGEVLGWKFNYAPGIRTRDNELVSWPASLGPAPTQSDIDTWTAEFGAVVDDLKADAELARRIDGAFADFFFNHENRLRTLEGQPALDRSTFNSALRGRIKANLT